jgi:hypothetical protein
MLRRVKPEEPLAMAVEHRLSANHFRVEHRPPRQQSMKEPAMAVGPFHHRCNAKSMR